MTPKERAENLVHEFYEINPENPYQYGMEWGMAKKCAMIAVENEYNSKIQAYNSMSEFCPDIACQAVFYAEKEREQVKIEIEKL